MRQASIDARTALRDRLSNPQQLPPDVPDAAMPPYMESFLAHLRLLVGVPFEYLVPDERLLPNESIRFFYLDRSWTDRLVDGAIAVGKIGTREQAHHAEQALAVNQGLDLSERSVRQAQRSIGPIRQIGSQAGIITGFLLRSAAVVGWPHMDVRAFSKVVHPPPSSATADDLKTWLADAMTKQIKPLRIERLSPAVLFALFDGVPQMVWCEEPHHCVQFGVIERNGRFAVSRHTRIGTLENKPDIAVPVRQANRRVISAAGLRRRLFQSRDADMPDQRGSADFAIEVLDLPWRQRFQNEGGRAFGDFNAAFAVAQVAAEPLIQQAIVETVS
jgi:hypothetical protein